MVAPIVAQIARTATRAIKTTKKKISRPKTKADERYNERRRARRAVDRLENQAKLQAGTAQKETLKQVAKLRQAISESYIDKRTKEYKKTLTQLQNITQSGREFSRRISEQTKQLSFQENQRLTKMQENYFRSATRTQDQLQANEPRSTQQKLARAEASFFYAKTRILWLGGSEAMRNENIVAGLSQLRLESGRKIQNLQDAVQWVKENFENEYPTMKDVMAGKYDTDSDIKFQEEEELEDSSPPPISRSELRAMGAHF